MSEPNTEIRAELLGRLLSYEEPLDALLAQIREYDWDSESDLVLLKLVDLENAISRYRSGVIAAHDLEAWAEAIEGREDVGFEPRHEHLVGRIIFELANPDITHEISVGQADSWLSEIERATRSSELE